MSFYLEEECKVPFEFEYQQLAEKVVAFCLEHEGFPYAAEVSLTLTDDVGIHEINKEFRQTDCATDVLSFPLLSYEKAGEFAFLEKEDGEDFNPDTGEVMLGDIMISVEHVLLQAENYGHSVRREFAFLIVHSMLHLFGYDHMTESEAAIMEEKQRQILAAMNISREAE